MESTEQQQNRDTLPKDSSTHLKGTPSANPEVNNPETDSRKSWVWSHFKFVENMTETNYPYCNKLIRCHVKKNGTSVLGNHLKTTCRTSPVYKGNVNKK